jgi:DNA-binding transcriptional MerR regulator
MSDRTKQGRLLTIGALARATGVPVETLRTWERRYGFPEAERTHTGHRRYTLDTVERVRLVRSVMQLGHRPSIALTASEPQLKAMLGQSAPQPAAEREALAASAEADLEVVERWLAMIRRFDGRGLDRELRLSLASIGAQRFLAQRVGPFIWEIGERWSKGHVGVRHEHFASERLNEFFSRHWQPLSDTATGPSAICATPSGERHALGLQMATLTLALNNVRVVYLGADVPALEIVQSIQQHGARALVLSAAIGVERAQLQSECDALRLALGSEFPIIVGGRGFEGTLGDLTHLANLAALDQWARTFALGFSPN